MTVKKRVKSFPKYQIHKASKRAFIWWQGKRHYLGVANSAASIELYNQLIGEIAQNQGLCHPDLFPSHAKEPEKVTISLLMARYLIKIQKEISSKEVQNTKYSFRPLRKLFGHTPVDQFGPRALKQIQQEMVREGLPAK